MQQTKAGLLITVLAAAGALAQQTKRVDDSALKNATKNGDDG